MLFCEYAGRDSYLLQGRPGATLAAVTVNPYAARRDFAEDALYTFHFDDAGEPYGGPFRVVRNRDLRIVLAGQTGRLVKGECGISAYAGPAPGVTAGDTAELVRFLKAIFTGPPPHVSMRGADREFRVIALELPNHLIGRHSAHGWPGRRHGGALPVTMRALLTHY